MNPLARLSAYLVDQAHLAPALVTAEALAPLVEERRKALRLPSATAYAHHALADPAEMDRLRDRVAVPETWLFRYPASYELLRKHLRDRSKPQATLLSVPCATGAEAFSMAATARAAGLAPDQVKVLAVDSSQDALNRAREAVMGRFGVRDPLPSWALPYFSTVDDETTPAASLQRTVEWRLGAAPAALADLPEHGFDAIFCRNLAIYLRPEIRAQLGQRLLQLLAPDGLLFLGHAEPPSVFGLDSALQPVEPRASFAFQRCAAAAAAEEPATQRRGKGAARSRPPRKSHGVAAAAPGVAPSAPAAPAARTSVPPLAPPAEPAPTVHAVRAAADAGRLHEAVHLAERCIASGDRTADVLLLLGSAHAALGNTTQAEECLRKVVYLDPGHVESLLHLAALAERRGDHDMAQRYRARAARSSSASTGGGST